MEKINFEDLPSTKTPIDSTNLNLLQTNVENAINGVVESGTNSNGNYIKYADGTMICFQPKVFSVSDYEQWGVFYRKVLSNPFTFPVPFTTFPTVTFSGRNTSSSQLVNIIDGAVIDQNGVNSIQLFRPNNSSGETVINYIAIGKWK